jgi:uncharacterized protein YcbK (DUF882 family)
MDVPMHDWSRREFLGRAALAAPAVLLSDRLFAAAERSVAVDATSRALMFHHTHTGENLTAEYFCRGAYVPDVLAAINRHLRDFRTGDEHVIDPALLDLLHRLAAATGTTKPFEVISGYRSPKTNHLLREKSTGVAASSLHMVGKAIDIRLPDVRLAGLREAALALHAGGVGYYPDSNFVHVDTGRVRRW